MDATQWQQHQQISGLVSRTMDGSEVPTQQHNTITSSTPIINNNNNNNPANSSNRAPVVVDQRKGSSTNSRPQKEQHLNCPRCNSTNTKFCYYNNYSLTQPRYFCKTCRRYWTQGGSLRNVPVGGGSRKNKRSSSSSSITTNPSTPSKLIPDLNPPISNNTSFSHLLNASSQNPKFLEAQDLNLAFPIQGMFQPLDHELPKIEGNNPNNNNNENHEPPPNNSNNINIISTSGGGGGGGGGANSCNNTSQLSALELLRTGIASRRSLNSYIPIPMQMPMQIPQDSNNTTTTNSTYPSSIFTNLQDMKPNLGVFTSPTSDHHQHPENENHHMMGSDQGGGGGARLLFPFADMNKLATTTTQHDQIETHHHHHHHQSNKGGNDHDQGHGHDHHDSHDHDHNHHQEAVPTHGYWSGMLGGGTW